MARVFRRSIWATQVAGGGTEGFVERRAADRPKTVSPDAPPPRRLRSTRSTTLAQERVNAAEIVDRVKALMNASLDDVRAGRKADLASLLDGAGEVTRSVQRNRYALINLTRLKSRHEYTYLHSIAVCALMVGLARELGVDPARIEQLGFAGLVHDIGKARIPLDLLDKPGALTPEERVTIMTHSERGHALLKTMGDVPPIALDVTLHHHERIDGSGYPHGLAGEAISVESRIAAICDVYDALTSQRAYKDGWSSARALEWMSGATGHFDSAMLAVFRRLIGSFPAGALVRLRSDRLAIVIDDPAGDPSYPGVVAFQYATQQHMFQPCRADTRLDPIVSIERPDRWHFGDWDTLRTSVIAQAA